MPRKTQARPDADEDHRHGDELAEQPMPEGLAHTVEEGGGAGTVMGRHEPHRAVAVAGGIGRAGEAEEHDHQDVAQRIEQAGDDGGRRSEHAAGIGEKGAGAFDRTRGEAAEAPGLLVLVGLGVLGFVSVLGFVGVLIARRFARYREGRQVDPVFLQAVTDRPRLFRDGLAELPSLLHHCRAAEGEKAEGEPSKNQADDGEPEPATEPDGLAEQARQPIEEDPEQDSGEDQEQGRGGGPGEDQEGDERHHGDSRGRRRPVGGVRTRLVLDRRTLLHLPVPSRGLPKRGANGRAKPVTDKGRKA